jgi:hypothetical protein
MSVYLHALDHRSRARLIRVACFRVACFRVAADGSRVAHGGHLGGFCAGAAMAAAARCICLELAGRHAQNAENEINQTLINLIMKQLLSFLADKPSGREKH